MKVQEQIIRHIVNEYSLSEYATNKDELKEWDRFVYELINKIINGRQFHLYVNNYKNKSILQGLDSFTKGKYNGVKYGILSSSNTNILSEIIEESEFYLGEIYLLLGRLSEDILKDFVNYINFQNKACYSPPLECVRMDDDGESVYWINPSYQGGVINFLDSIKNTSE